MKEQEIFDFRLEPGKERTVRKILYSGDPLISIVTPYYNADKYINQTANSILNQTFPYFEWIIVDDGSTDENAKRKLKDLKEIDARIRILYQENSGPAAARYFGAKMAKSDIIFCLDADDLIDNTMLECGYFTLLTNQDAAFAYTPICTFGDNNYLYSPMFDTLKEKKENTLQGTIVDRVYDGASTNLTIRVNKKKINVMYLGNDKLYSRGQSVYITWDIEDTIVLKREAYE